MDDAPVHLLDTRFNRLTPLARFRRFNGDEGAGGGAPAPAAPVTPPVAPVAPAGIDPAERQRIADEATAAAKTQFDTWLADEAEKVRIAGLGEAEQVRAHAEADKATAAKSISDANQLAADSVGLQALILAGFTPEVANTLVPLMGNKHGDTIDGLAANVARIDTQFAAMKTVAPVAELGPDGKPIVPALPPAPGVSTPPAGAGAGSVTDIELGRQRALANRRGNARIA